MNNIFPGLGVGASFLVPNNSDILVPLSGLFFACSSAQTGPEGGTKVALLRLPSNLASMTQALPGCLRLGLCLGLRLGPRREAGGVWARSSNSSGTTKKNLRKCIVLIFKAVSYQSTRLGQYQAEL